jgi:hypothetical protein
MQDTFFYHREERSGPDEFSSQYRQTKRITTTAGPGSRIMTFIDLIM